MLWWQGGWQAFGQKRAGHEVAKARCGVRISRSTPDAVASTAAPFLSMQDAAGTYLQGILGFEERPLVSTGAAVWGAVHAAALCSRGARWPPCTAAALWQRHAAAPSLQAALPPFTADYVNDSRSGIVDAACTQVIDGTMVKIYAW